jgi:hypothetical protein
MRTIEKRKHRKGTTHSLLLFFYSAYPSFRCLFIQKEVQIQSLRKTTEQTSSSVSQQLEELTSANINFKSQLDVLSRSKNSLETELGNLLLLPFLPFVLLSHLRLPFLTLLSFLRVDEETQFGRRVSSRRVGKTQDQYFERIGRTSKGKETVGRRYQRTQGIVRDKRKRH